MRRFPAFALAFAAALLATGCRKSEPETTETSRVSAPRTISLKSGTPLELVLLDELTSGGSEVGQEVHLALAEESSGLPALSPVKARVSASRTEGTLGGLTGRPARLNIELISIKAPDGSEIPISAEEGEPKEYELNRGNTGRPDAQVTEKTLEQTPESTQLAVQELIQKGSTAGLNAEEVSKLASNLQMSETAKLAQMGKLNEAQELIRKVRAGDTITNLASGTPVAAALEMVKLAGSVGRRLNRTLGGRNIRAYPGTHIPAFVAKDATITLSSQ